MTLGADLLAHLGIQPGEDVVVAMLPNGRAEMMAARPTGRISDVFDLLHREGGPSLTIDEINDAVIRGWAGER